MMCEADDLGEANREEDEGDEGGEELENAEGVKDKVVSSASWGIPASHSVIAIHLEIEGKIEEVKEQ